MFSYSVFVFVVFFHGLQKLKFGFKSKKIHIAKIRGWMPQSESSWSVAVV